MAELGIGLVGCGGWGQLLARRIQELDGGRMVAVQNRTFSRAESFASELGVVAHETYQELLADPNVQAVLVSNPHTQHEEVVVTRLYPVYKRAAEVARSGRLGQLAAMHVNSMVHINRVRWWARSETMGALLHSPGVHAIDFLLHVCGKATSVYAVESRVRVQQGVDYQDSLFLLVEFESGVIGSVDCTVSCLTPDRRGQIVGTLGSLTYDPSEKWVDVATWKGERERIDVSLIGDRWARLAIGVGTELESFIDWVVHDTEPILTGWDGLWAVEIIDAAYRSIAQKRPISLPLPRP